MPIVDHFKARTVRSILSAFEIEGFMPEKEDENKKGNV